MEDLRCDWCIENNGKSCTVCEDEVEGQEYWDNLEKNVNREEKAIREWTN